MQVYPHARTNPHHEVLPQINAWVYSFPLECSTNRAVFLTETVSIKPSISLTEKILPSYNLFSVNLQLNLSNAAPQQWGGQARGGGFSFPSAHGDGDKAGRLKWLRTSSGNRIYAPALTTHTHVNHCREICQLCVQLWETPLTSLSLDTEETL